MSTKKQRNRLWAEQRIAHDVAIEEARNRRESDLTEQEKEILEPKKKTAKSKKSAPQGKEKK